MYNQPFFIPGYQTIPNMMSRGMMPATFNQVNRINLFSRLGNSIKSIKAFNWSGLINNTSKTLGIINQTIPLAKQVGPMVGNVRSMIKLASVFKDETDKPSIGKNNYYSKGEKKESIPTSNEDSFDSPTFFIN